MFYSLSAAVDELQSLDPDSLGDDELSAAVLEAERQRVRLEAAQLRLVSAWDARKVWALDGSRSGAAWLAHRTKAPLTAMRSVVRLGRRLRTMPATAAALAAGEIGMWAARLLAELNRPGLQEALAADEHELVDVARSADLLAFGRHVRYWEQLHAPDDVEKTEQDDFDARHAFMSETTRGIRVLDAEFDAVGGATFQTELKRIEQELFEQDWAAAKHEWGDGTTTDKLARTPKQRRLDALVEMARRSRTAPPDGRRPRPLLTVLVDYETLAGRICQLSDGTVLTPGQVVPLLTEAEVERVVFGPDARVLEVGKRARFFTGALRRAIEVRDLFCTFPGCYRPADECQIDHTKDYALGGETTQDNGGPACGPHNRGKERGFTVERRPDGSFVHRRPGGTLIS